MPYTANSLLRSPGTIDGPFINSHSRTFPQRFDGQTLVDLSTTTGLNIDVMYAHMLLETGNGSSTFWVLRNNPGGLGAIDSKPGDAITFDTPRDGLIADYSHMLTYVDGDNNVMRETDPRFTLVPAKNRGTIARIGQLGNGVWASDPDYASKVVRIANQLSAVSAAPPPAPPRMEPDVRYSLPVRLDLANNAHSWINRPSNPNGQILAIVKHVTDGESIDGALSWNRNPNVPASAHFYIGKDGTVVQDVSLWNGAFSNGDLKGDTLPSQFDIVKRHNWNPNDFTIAIEHVGMPADADFPTGAQLAADARLTADLCDYFKVPVDLDHILGHYRFDSVNRARCPGPHWDFWGDVVRVSKLLNP